MLYGSCTEMRLKLLQQGFFVFELHELFLIYRHAS